MTATLYADPVPTQAGNPGHAPGSARAAVLSEISDSPPAFRERPIILLADDNPRDVDLALHALARSGLEQEVVTVRDGVAVMDYLRSGGVREDGRSRRPTVVLLDMKMPRMDGLEALRQIKADPGLKTIPVVLFSSSQEGIDLVRAYAAGANSYVVKPLLFERFTEVVRMIAGYWGGVNVAVPDPPAQDPSNW
ncbi:MAG: response regulator [Verrucomicrobiae bacterium]|nr:response regulator [Verrucomicrobiae bacterium]